MHRLNEAVDPSGLEAFAPYAEGPGSNNLSKQEASDMRVGIINDTRAEDGHIGCSIVMRNLEKLLEESDIVPVWYWPVGQDWRDHKDKILAMGHIDAVIVNGEGTIHHSESGRRAHMLADIAAFAKAELHCPAFLINASLFMNAPDLYVKCAGFQNIFVRDSASAQELNINGLAGTVVPDLTLALPATGVPTLSRAGIGATDSVVRNLSSALRQESRQHGWDYRMMVTPDKFRFKFRDIFRPLQTYGKMRDFASDRRFARYSPNPATFLDWLRSKQLIVTGRYHAVTLCLLTRTPFIAIESNTPKISALLSDVFGSNVRLVRDMAHIKDSSIFCNFEFDDHECKAIDTFLEHALRSNRNMICQIKESLASGAV